METALSLMTILFVVFTVIAFSEAAYARHFVASAARQAVRYAIVRGSSFTGVSCSGASFSCQATASDVRSYILSNLPPGISASNVTVTTLWPGIAATGLNCLTLSGTNSPGCDVQVTVTYNFAYHLPYVPTQVLSLQSTSAMPIQQ